MEAQTTNSLFAQNRIRPSLTLMKKILLVAATLFLAALAFAFYLYNKPHQGIEDETPHYTLTAETITNDFSASEEKANEKYLGKIVAVSGIIAEKSRDKQGNYNITLQGPDLSGVGCQFDPKEQKKASELKEGQKVTIKGICTGVLMDVVLVDCVLEN